MSVSCTWLCLCFSGPTVLVTLVQGQSPGHISPLGGTLEGSESSLRSSQACFGGKSQKIQTECGVVVLWSLWRSHPNSHLQAGPAKLQAGFCWALSVSKHPAGVNFTNSRIYGDWLWNKPGWSFLSLPSVKISQEKASCL